MEFITIVFWFLIVAWIIAFVYGCWLVTFFNENNNDRRFSNDDDAATL